jgi:hypothetical protein
MKTLRAELRAIRQFQPAPEMRTQTERDAILIRGLRIAETDNKDSRDCVEELA